MTDKKLFPYQEEGIKLMTEKFHDVLLADHPGAGKTCQAILAARNIKGPILVVCPASLRENWKREWEKWTERDKEDCRIDDVLCIYGPDDFLTLCIQIYIISYDLAVRYVKNGEDAEWDLIIFDEAHYLKNPKSKRSEVCLKTLWNKAKKHILITGTPLPNGRAIEAWPIFHALCPSEFPNEFDFKKKFCVKEVTPWGVNWNKSKNLPELGRIAREKFMIRRDRAETIGQLPPFVRMTVPLDVEYEDKISQGYSMVLKYEDILDQKNDMEIKSARRAHGIAKVNAAVEYIKNLLEEVDSCVVFAHHADVISGIECLLSMNKISYVKLTGASSAEGRQNAIDKFQDGEAQVFLGSLLAANTGITLTRAADVVFVEADWVPSNNEQAEGRIYRISQTQISRFHYLVIPDSLDDTITSSILRKQRDIMEVMGETAKHQNTEKL